MKKVILVFLMFLASIFSWLGFHEFRAEKEDAMVQMEIVQSIRREYVSYISDHSRNVGNETGYPLANILVRSLSELGYQIDVDRQDDEKVSAFGANVEKGVSFQVELFGDGSVNLKDFKLSR